jgi:hypothetical protein
MDVGLIGISSNPLADAPAPMRMSFKDADQEEDVPPLQQLSKATGQTEEQLVALGDEDLLMLMQEAGFLGVAAKNAVLLEVTKLRNPPPAAPAAAAGDDGGGDDGGGGLDVDALNARWDEHMERLAWGKCPKDAIIRWASILTFIMFMYSIYADGAYHFESATAESDQELLEWAEAYGGRDKLQLHGPTDWNHRLLAKTWYGMPQHHAVYLDFRLWAVGQCGMCEGENPPEAVIMLDGQTFDRNGDGKTFKRRTNYYVGATSDDLLNEEKANSAFRYEFSVHAQDLPAPGPKSNSAAFAKVSLRLPHSASNLSLVVEQAYGDVEDYAAITQALGMQQLMIDAVQVRYGVCPRPEPEAALPPLSRRTAAQMAVDRANARALVVAASANCSFEPGQGAGAADEFIGEAATPQACAELVVRQRPAANGASYSAPPTGHGCWAEYGMTERAIDSASLKFVSAFLGGGGELGQVTLHDDFIGGDNRGWNVLDDAQSDLLPLPAETMTCGSFGEILGGFGLGAGKSLEKTYDLSRQPRHTMVILSLRFLKIDSWDGEAGVVYIDGSQVWKSQSLNFQDDDDVGGGRQCGSEASPHWTERAVEVGPISVAHSAESLRLTVTTTLDQDGSDESFGISNINLKFMEVGASWVASESKMKCVSAIQSAGEPGYRPACCSDTALPGFAKHPGADRICPWYSDSSDDTPVGVGYDSARLVCAAHGARQCTKTELNSGCLPPLPPLAGEGNEGLTWTEDACDSPGKELRCTETACEEINFSCHDSDLMDLEQLTFADETEEQDAGTIGGWSMPITYTGREGGEDGGGGGPSWSSVHASRSCDDSQCSSQAHDCCAPGDEASTCDRGAGFTEVVYVSDDRGEEDKEPGAACVTYTCCIPEARVEGDRAAVEAGYDPAAPISEYSLGYLYDEQDVWSPAYFEEHVPFTVQLSTAFSGGGGAESSVEMNVLDDSAAGTGDDTLWWTYILVCSFLFTVSYRVACAAPEMWCAPLPVYPYIGQSVGRGKFFELSGGYADRRLEQTQTRVVLRANVEGCACCPGRCGGFKLPVEQELLPRQLRERGVPEAVWNEAMVKQKTLQKRYSKVCDIPMRWSAGCLAVVEMPWWLKLKMAWASNCYSCCGCCWRCCCCCECGTCCCFPCSTCCCPGAGGFLGLWWHMGWLLLFPFIPWARCDPYQHAMRWWLEDFNKALAPHGVNAKIFSFAMTNADGGRHPDDNSSLSTLVFGLSEDERKIMEMEPVVQSGHHHDPNCPACWNCFCHSGRVV